jgi:NAD(P)-dependent dehydrogenase (short-subunit alcohol dehydrogenase family)
MSLQGRVALITGAGSGLGEAAAIRLGKEGAKIGALGRTEEELQATVDTIKQHGGEGMVLVADISKPEQMEQAVQKLVDAYGRLDIVFANAGVNGKWAPLEDLSPDDWRKTIDINLNGTFFTVKYATPHLKKQGGAIVITSSVNGTRMFSNTGASAYASTKAAQVAFAKMIALELAEDRVRVNVICPGAIESEIDENTNRENLEHVQEPVEFPEGKIPLTDGKPGESEDVAQLVYFLVSDMSKHISGTEVWIDGAQSLLQG